MVAQSGRAAAPGNELVAQAAGELPVGYDLDHILNDAGAGVNNMGAGDLGIPYLVLLMTNSPQCNPASAKYIPDAKAGSWMNSATGSIFGPNLLIVPCAYERKYVEWKDRDKGEGGYVGDHALDSGILSQTKKDDKKRNVLPNGNMIYETAYQYVLYQNPKTGRWEEAVIAMKSTHLTANRRLNNLIVDAVIPGTDKQAPRWLFPYDLGSQGTTSGNNSWFVPTVERQAAPVSLEVYNRGKQFHEMFAQGQVSRAAEGDVEEGSSAPQGAGGARPASAADDEIPF